MEDRFYYLKEVASMLHCSESTLGRRMKVHGLRFKERLLSKAQVKLIMDTLLGRDGKEGGSDFPSAMS
jgi:hypothetical protein